MQKVMRKICKYLRNKHAAVIILQFLHSLGIISLPHFYKNNRKNKIHKIYSFVVNTIYFIGLISWTVASLKYSITDAAECCGRFFELAALLLLSFQAYHLKFNLKNVLLINDFFEITWRSHRNVDVVLLHTRREKVLIFPLALQCVITIMGVLLLCLLLPQTEEQYVTMKTVYKLKYPENMLPLPMYIPFVDPSDPRYFTALYIYQAYFFVIGAVAALVGIFNYVLMPHNIRVLYDLLNKYARALGRIHTNHEGVRVFYTNIARGEYVEPNPSEERKYQSRKAAEDVLYAQYAYFYLKRVVQFEQDLRKIRRKYESYIKIIHVMMNIIFLSAMSITFFAFFTPSLLTALEKKKLTVEASMGFMAYASIFIMGEVYASCNVAFKRGLMNSHWYKCSRDTQKIIPLIISANQTNGYITVAGLIPWSFDSMVSTLKAAYSVFNLLRIQSVKNT